MSVPLALPSKLSYDEYQGQEGLQCRWEDETVWERTGKLTLYADIAEVKKLTLYT